MVEELDVAGAEVAEPLVELAGGGAAGTVFGGVGGEEEGLQDHEEFPERGGGGEVWWEVVAGCKWRGGCQDPSVKVVEDAKEFVALLSGELVPGVCTEGWWGDGECVEPCQSGGPVILGGEEVSVGVEDDVMVGESALMALFLVGAQCAGGEVERVGVVALGAMMDGGRRKEGLG